MKKCFIYNTQMIRSYTEYNCRIGDKNSLIKENFFAELEMKYFTSIMGWVSFLYLIN